MKYLQQLGTMMPYALFSACSFILPLAAMLVVDQNRQILWSFEFWWVIAVGVLCVSALTAVTHKIASPKIQRNGIVFTTGLVVHFAICVLLARFFVRSGAFVAIN